jgi:hypothetical protein
MMKTAMRLLGKHDGLQALAQKNIVPEQEETPMKNRQRTL